MLLLVLPCGCFDKGCTDLGCPIPVSVQSAPDGGVWEPGEYELESARDGRTSSCSFSAPSDGTRE